MIPESHNHQQIIISICILLLVGTDAKLKPTNMNTNSFYYIFEMLHCTHVVVKYKSK